MIMPKVDNFAALASSAGGPIVGSLIDYGLNGLNMARQQQYNVQNMRLQMKLRREQQRQQLSDLLGSGFNPAFGSDSPSVSGPSSSNPTPGSFSTKINLLEALATSMQLSSMKEDIQRKKLENKGLAIDIANKEARRNEFGNALADRGEEGSITFDPGAEGRIQARQYLGEYETLLKEFEDRRTQADFRRLVSQGKMDNDEVMHAIINMDKQTYDSIVADIRNKGLEATYKDLMNKFQQMENEEFKATKWSQFLADMKSDMSLGDKILSVLGFIAMNFVKRR